MHDLYNCKINNCICFILNLSGHAFTVQEKLLLSKGLSFIPTARDVNNFEILSDFDYFAYKLRKQTKPHSIRPINDGFTLYRKPTDFTNMPTNYPLFEGALESIKIQLSQLPTNNKPAFNLSKRQHFALKSLMQNNNIIINKADKGSTVVIQNRNDYIDEALTHLNDTVTYQPLSGDSTNHICQQIKNVLTDFLEKCYITKNMYLFCLPPPKARLARIYFLKKIHKNPMGIRPIVSSCLSPTENISQFIDYWLQPHIKQLLSYLKDTTQFIQEVETLHIPHFQSNLGLNSNFTFITLNTLP